MNLKNLSDQEPVPAALTSVYDLTIDDLKLSVNEFLNEADNTPQHPFVTRTANDWLALQRDKPVSRKLFGEFWFENELCILFSDTNVGKSILAVQIGDSISKGEGITPFEADTTGQCVLYFDFELSSRQFETRYVDEDKNPYHFGQLHRSELNTQIEVPAEFRNFEEYICFMIAHEVIKEKATVVIIDNITYLRSETERAKDALPLMKQLKALKEKFGLSILALAHTPKRDKSSPITRNDLQGSKMLINFCDSAFSIGESYKDNHIRYLKQIKQRNTEELYGEKNVLVYQICKPGNFLHYSYLGCGSEWEHLKKRDEEDVDKVNDQVLDMHNKGFTLRQIGAELGISHTYAGKVIKTLKDL